METYIIKLYRRQEPDEAPVLAGIVEDAASSWTARFADADGLLQLLQMNREKAVDRKEASARSCEMA